MMTMSKQDISRISVAGLLLAAVVLAIGMAPSPGAAQNVDARWLPWLGCWEAADGGDEVPLLCVRPASEGAGVEFVTWAQGETTVSDAIFPDGVSRNVEREECQGMEEARFSADGHRVYLKSEYICEGGELTEASGILAMINPMEWVDIKAVEGSPWVLRYRLARSSLVEEAGLENVVAPRATAVKRARIAASARMTEEAIIDAAGQVDGAALEALIVERGDPFAVDADMLVRLDNAGVPAGVIDLVVAVSFPDRFAVKAGPLQVEEYAMDQGYAGPSIYMAGGYYDPFYFGMGYGYSPYYYGGYGYGYGYPYGGYPYHYPTPIVVAPRTQGGRMIKGQGYTTSGGRSGYTGRTAGSRSGGSGAVRSGSSPGRSSGSSGRTAKPRSGGGTSGKVSSSGPARSSSSSKVRRAKPRGGGGLM